MGFYYLKSLNFGPFRVNLGKSGVGYFLAGRGFRLGRLRLIQVVSRKLMDAPDDAQQLTEFQFPNETT